MKQSVLVVTECEASQQQQLRALFSGSTEYDLLAMVSPASAEPMAAALKPDVVALDGALANRTSLEQVIARAVPRALLATLVKSPFHLLVHRRSVDPRAPERPKSATNTARVGRSLVVIAASTGGPDAVALVLSALPASFMPPILLAQHIASGMDNSLVHGIRERTGRDVRLAIGREKPAQGVIYVAPSDKHLVLNGGPTGPTLALSSTPPENSCRPAADPLFRSVASLMGARTIALVLTGIGRDGTAGCEALRARGGYVIAQDESSSTVWGMPGSVVKAGLANEVLPLNKIGTRLAGMPFVSLSSHSVPVC